MFRKRGRQGHKKIKQQKNKYALFFSALGGCFDTMSLMMRTASAIDDAWKPMWRIP